MIANPRLNFPGGEQFARFIMLLLRFDKLNRVFNEIGDKKGSAFASELLQILSIKYAYDSESFTKRIPQSGACIIIANQPFGGLESILLIKILSEVRSDIKIVSNSLLQKIGPIGDYFLDSNPFSKKVSIQGQEKVVEHLAQGGILCLFPAGEVSHFDNSRVLSDKQWQLPTLKFIKQQKVPVLPVNFQGNNSRLFYLLERLHYSLGQLKLPTEILYQKKKSVKVRIGNPITVTEQEKFQDIYQYGRFLRARTYCLSSNIEVKKFFNYSLKRQQKIEQIADQMAPEIIKKELDNLSVEYFLFKVKNFHVYCAPSKRIPNILLEIGRLREITFRQVGEGTNRSIDLDEFDLYYDQLFIWDNENQSIVGAYRIGKGDEIIHKYGIRGFYVHSLFKIKENLHDMLKESLELGRSFITEEYQKKPLPLFLLWKGILYFTLKNPQYRYLMGPVSISNNYSTVSKEVIIKFIMTHYIDWQLARSITPRKPYKFKATDPSLNVLMETMNADINSLDRAIGDIDEVHSGLPVLLKKYIKLNAKIIGFNVDPKFNYSLDGLIVLDMFDVPQDIIESLSKEANDSSILRESHRKQPVNN
ncbi:MAG: lysophospholipid acyltransferase family protein [Candidatus Saccharibacteria bacterium]